MTKEYTMMIGGKSVAAAKHFTVSNLSTGEAVGAAPDATRADLDAAVAAAKTAFESWSQKSDAALQAACEAVTAKLGEDAEELAELITKEQGKPLNGLGSRWEMGGAGAWAGYTSGLSIDMKVLQDNNEGLVELQRKPLGVVGSITPWNFPVMIAIWHIMPALRTATRL